FTGLMRRNPDREARRVDEAVQLVFRVVNDDPPPGDPLHPSALSVDEDDIGKVKGLQVVVAIQRPLAEQVVPGLEGLCCGFIFHDRTDTSTYLLHLLIVSQLQKLGRIGACGWATV